MKTLSKIGNFLKSAFHQGGTVFGEAIKLLEEAEKEIDVIVEGIDPTIVSTGLNAAGDKSATPEQVAALQQVVGKLHQAITNIEANIPAAKPAAPAAQ